MRKAKVTVAEIESLVVKMAGGAELGGVLEGCGYSMSEARKILRSTLGRRVMKRMKELQDLQRQFTLDRFGPEAVATLGRKMSAETDAALRLKGAISLLGMWGKKKAGEEVVLEKEERAVVVSEEEAREILVRTAEEAEERDRERYAG